MQVKEIMTPDVEVARPDDTLETAARMMADLDVGVLPVGENDRLVGMITDRDITTRAVAEGTDVRMALVRDFCSSDPVVVGPNAALDEALQLMARNSLRRLPVVEDTRLVGILAQADVAVETKAKETGELVEAISQAPDTERR